MVRHSSRMLVRVLVTGFSAAAIALGFSMGGSPLIHPGRGIGDIMMFIGVVVLCGFWSLAGCNWYAASMGRQYRAETGSEESGVADRRQMVGS
jgi:hypothetical protein